MAIEHSTRAVSACCAALAIAISSLSGALSTRALAAQSAVTSPAQPASPGTSPAASPSATTLETWAPLIARAKDVAQRLASGDLEPVVATFTDQMKAAARPEQLRAILPAVAAQMGAFLSPGNARTDERETFRAVAVSANFERGSIDVITTFDANGRIAGISLRPAVDSTAYTAPAYVTAASFRVREVTVDAGGWPLPGTLTVPVGEGPFPAIVLVHGSGPNDRDSSFGPNRIFRDLAEGLASHGIAVLRYEKRTRVHASRMGKLRTFTVSDETVDDAVAAVRLLQGTSGIRSDRVFVLGHSLGGMLAPRIAVAEPTIAGLVVMAGPVRTLEQSILDQVRYLANVDGTVTPEEQQQIEVIVKLAADIRALQPSSPPVTAPGFAAPASYFLDLRGYSAPTAARTVPRRMLILQGGRDYQVTPADFAIWQQTLASRTDVEFMLYPALNHLFITGTGASSPAEYATPGHVEEAVVTQIARWITR